MGITQMRLNNKYSMFKEEKNIGTHEHYWRTLECDGSRDIVECSKCGKQRTVSCNFDDEYS